MAIWVMAMVRSLENLEKIVADGALGVGGSLFRHLLDNGGEIATAALFQNMENPSISINVSVMISYDVVMMKVLENVLSRHLLLSVSGEDTGVNQDAHFCNNLLSISLAYPLKVEFFTREYL